MDRLLLVKLLCRVNAVRNAVKKQKFHTSVQQLSANDANSSSDSSDSDNEQPKKNRGKKNLMKPRDEAAKQQTVDLLNNLLTTMNKSTSASKKMEFAMPVKKHVKPVKPPTLEKKLVDAAKEVAKTLGGKVREKEEELLNKIFSAGIPEQPAPATIQKKTKNKKIKKQEEISIELSSPTDDTENIKKKETKAKAAVEPTPSLTELLSGMKIDKTKKEGLEGDDLTMSRYMRVKQLTAKLEMPMQRIDSSRVQPKMQEEIPCNLYNGTPLNVFHKGTPDKIFTTTLSTWEALKQDELKFMTIHPPKNYFEEMIRWTEQGILWKFPIDNEQGMEAEQNVHFSEHVFLEKHLHDWCPKKGPIRHFMELVCVGLSKNPYMTVEEKKEHIMWYRDYFGDKQELLKEINAIETNILPDAAENKQLEA